MEEKDKIKYLFLQRSAENMSESCFRSYILINQKLVKVKFTMYTILLVYNNIRNSQYSQISPFMYQSCTSLLFCRQFSSILPRFPYCPYKFRLDTIQCVVWSTFFLFPVFTLVIFDRIFSYSLL